MAPTERLAPYATPALVIGLTAGVLLLVPPLAAGPLALGEAYIITAALVLLAVGYGAPYAAVVAVGTLALLRLGYAGYASPTVADGGPSTTAAVRHAGAGFGYGLASACVGSVLVGAEVAGLPLPGAFPIPSGAVVGGLLVGGAFVASQLWRYRALDVAHDWQTVATTAALGALLCLSPAVTYWRFGGRLGGL
ncbi:hypothetical protein [Haloplanus sp. C73]|uniref:hypothetical protein n=1 Tax=Haloplanus sp. C73 TaxID=3421641 RepID=UPI003EC10023